MLAIFSLKKQNEMLFARTSF